jgi:hypothetical protein
VKAAPSTRPFIERAGLQIIAGNIFKALKELQGLIDYERQLLGTWSAPAP